RAPQAIYRSRPQLEGPAGSRFGPASHEERSLRARDGSSAGVSTKTTLGATETRSPLPVFFPRSSGGPTSGRVVWGITELPTPWFHRAARNPAAFDPARTGPGLAVRSPFGSGATSATLRRDVFGDLA